MGQVEDAGFTEFVRTRSAGLLRTAYLLVGDAAQAEDLLQTALTKSYLSWRRIREPQATEAYVRRVLVTTATSWWRSSYRRRECLVLEELPEVAEPARTEEVEQRARLWTQILSLPPRQRAVVVLRYYEDRTEAETADLMGCTVGTVKSQAHRALRRLRSSLDADELGPRAPSAAKEEA